MTSAHATFFDKAMDHQLPRPGPVDGRDHLNDATGPAGTLAPQLAALTAGARSQATQRHGPWTPREGWPRGSREQRGGESAPQ
jgi:hypothetical protein